MKNIAILLAAGAGKRFGEDVPKQFVRVGSKMLFEYPLETFQQHPQIDEIFIVAPIEWLSEIQTLVETNGYTKVSYILSGGKERFESTMAALPFVNERDNVLLHDAARPLVSMQIITDCLAKLTHYAAVEVAVPCIDTIILGNTHGETEQVLERSRLYNVQTPQAFKGALLKRAYEQIENDFAPTDDISVVKKYCPDEPISIVLGDRRNFKITHKEDLEMLKILIINEKC